MAEPTNDVSEPSVETMTQWEFIDEVPTVEKVKELLATLPPVHGVKTVDYAEHVVALSQNTKVKLKEPDPRGGKPRTREVWHEVWRLYMSVAGRMMMLQEAAEKNGWAVSFEPEAETSPPGFLKLAGDDDRIVYREYVKVVGNDGHLLGRRPGTAAVPMKGGAGAAGSNPYEKVETSARGRALGAWGFGVLPGSGVASLEEMYGVQQVPQEAPRSDDGPASLPALLEETRTLMEEVRQRRLISREQMVDKVVDYVTKSFGVDARTETEAGEPAVAFDRLKAPQVRLVRNDLKATIRRIDAETSPL